MTTTCKACDWIANAAGQTNLVWQNDKWVLRHAAPPYPQLGWMTMHSRRHVPGIAAFNEQEATDFGLVVGRISQALMDAAGALRVYLGSLSEETPHFHVHLVPRYTDGPKGWDAFGDLARARQGLTNVDRAKVDEVIRFVSNRLAAG